MGQTLGLHSKQCLHQQRGRPGESLCRPAPRPIYSTKVRKLVSDDGDVTSAPKGSGQQCVEFTQSQRPLEEQ